MKLNPYTKRGMVVWLIALVIFALASVFGYSQGTDIVLSVADNFHKTRSEERIQQKNYVKAIEEYKAWLWLDPENDERTMKLVELHLLNKQPFEAYDRIEPLVESMQEDEYALCRLMTMIRLAEHKPEALKWAQRTLAVANESQQAEAKRLLATARGD